MRDRMYMRPILIFQYQAKNDNWMVNSSHDKMEQARIAREREMEVTKNMIESCVLHSSSLLQMLMVARSQAIEEEEMERAAEEAERRS